MWSSIEDILGQSLSTILNHLQAKYTQDSEALIYFTIWQNDLTTGIRSSVHVLKQNSIHTMVKNVMSTFHRFVNSNQSIELNNSFEVFLKVLSGLHVSYPGHRRKTVPLRSMVGSAAQSQWIKKGGIIDFASLAHYDSFFDNQCLLLSLFFLLFKSTQIALHNQIKQITKARVSLKQKQHVSEIFKSCISEFVTAESLPQTGPYDLIEIVQKFSLRYDCQIVVISALDGSRPDIFKYPTTFDFAKNRVYLFKRENHVMAINNIKWFFRFHKKMLCFGCDKLFTLRTLSKVHKCPQFKNCPLCHGILTQPNYILDAGETFQFCNSLVSEEPLRTCNNCNNHFKTKLCFETHQLRCKYNEMSYLCSNCNTYVAMDRRSPSEVEASHICGVKLIRCQTCFKYTTPQHDCFVVKSSKTSQWPIVATLNMAFKSNGDAEHCNDCYNLKLDFGKNHGLSLQELCKHPDFKKILCNLHLEGNNLNEDHSINAIVIWIETARFFFEQKTFLDDSLGNWFSTSDHTLFEYVDPRGAMPFSNEISNTKLKGLSRALNYCAESRYSLAEDKFFQFLVSGQCTNVTFLVDSNAVMFKLLSIFLTFHFQPVCIQRGKRLYALELTQLGIKFLNFSNYVPGNLPDWLKQFSINGVVPFFPQKFNAESFLDQVASKIMPFKTFIEFGDNDQIEAQKKQYYDTLSLNESVKSLMFQCLHRTSCLFLQITTSFLKQCFEIQKLVSDIENSVIKYPIHPFSRNILSCSSFVMQICKFYFLDKNPICTVHNPYNATPCPVSSGEFEYTNFIAWTEPGRNIKNAFSADTTGLRFGKIVVDAYSTTDKTAFFYNGCWNHAHNSEVCLNKNIRNTNLAVVDKIREKDLNATKTLLEKFSNLVQSVEIMWECEWQKFKMSNPDLMRAFWFETALPKNAPLIRLNSRASIRGGFLETYCLKYESSESRHITWVDTQSLYSKISMDCQLPIGGYKILTFFDLKNSISLNPVDRQFYYKNESMVCDIALVEILAPSDLDKPFLSYRINDEFVFMANCKMCALKKLTKPCRHSPKNRSFTSTWTCVELAYAVSELGYQILNWFEVHHYQSFKPLLADFVKILASQKLKTSNILMNKATLEDKEQYCDFINNVMQFDHPSLKLTPINCSDNPAGKNYFKMCLNSLFGRFALHSENTKHMFCKTLREIEAQASNPKTEIVDLITINEQIMEVIYVNKTTVKPNRNSNMYFTALINAKARIFIYDLVKRLSDLKCDVLSVDTDAICFAHDKNFKYPFHISDAFGHFKYVLGPNSKINGFYSTGVRSYIVTYTDALGCERYLTKLKGMSLGSMQTKDFITPDIFKNFIHKMFRLEIDKIYVPQSRERFQKQTKSFSNMISAHEFSNELHVKRFIVKNDPKFKTYSYGFDFKDVQ